MIRYSIFNMFIRSWGRLMCKLGDKSYKKYEQEVENDMAMEERQISKIRDLIKERNKTRAQTQRQRKMPAPKRTKIDETHYEPRKDKEQEERTTRGGEEKRELEDPAEAPPAKRRANKDIREMLRKHND